MAEQLSGLGVDFGYEDTTLHYVVKRRYKADFRIICNGVLIETKGYFTSADRSKMLAVRDQNPGADIRLLFQNAGKRLSKQSRTTYAGWCDQHGFKWAEGRAPEEWLK